MSVVDVEALFNKFSVAEVRDIERKIKTDIERKKEDLRQMVGRRYRDIIEAADSIRDMKVRADFILSSIKEVHSGFDRLQLLQQQLITAQQRAHFATYAPIDAGFSAETHLKFLQDIPELIWESLDDGPHPEVLSAVWFLLLGENLFQSLSLSLPPEDAAKRRILACYESRLKKQRFSIHLRCDELLSQGFRSDTESGSDDTMLIEDTEITNCFCAMMLLENLAPTEVLERLLASQKVKLDQVFDDTEVSSRVQICACIGVLQWTLMSSHRNFSVSSDGNTSLLKEKMDRIADGSWRPANFVEHLSRQSRVFNASLSADVRNFHPTLVKPVCDLEKSVLRESVTSWMHQCLDVSRENLSNSLVYFESIEMLTVLKKSVLETLQRPGAEEWGEACRRCLGSEMSLWDALIREHLDKRLQDLVTLRVGAEFAQMRQNVPSDNGEGVDRGLDLSEYLWKELVTDSPRISDHKNVSTLTLKARGVFPGVFAVCKKLDNGLRELQENLENHYDVSISESNPNLTADHRRRRRICSISGDFPEIWKCLANSCMKSITEFTGGMDKAVNAISDTSNDLYIFKLIQDAQLCGCLCELCPSLKTCLAYQNHMELKPSEEHKRRSQETELWRAAKCALSAAIVKSYGVWSKIAVDKAEKCLLRGESSFSLTSWLEEAQEWESIAIEEESETGEKVTSKLEVPVQCSRRLHGFFCSLARAVNSLGAHRMPKSALAVFVQSSQLCVVKFMQQLIRNSAGESQKLSQKQAIQLLFDLKVVAGLLASKSANPEEQAILNRQIAELTEKLHQFIDPFDLDVLSPHIKRNGAKLQHKILSLYGVFIMSETASNLSRTPATKTVAGSEQPQLLQLATGINRFQLLPVAAPSKTELLGSTHGPMKPIVHLHAAMSTVNVAEMERKRKGVGDDIAKSSSSAALSSFYDKISTGWFGM